MLAQKIVPIAVIAGCVITAVWVTMVRSSAKPKADAVADALAREVESSPSPAVPVMKAPGPVGGQVVLSLGEKPPKNLSDQEVELLRALVTGAKSSDTATVVQGRNAAMAAGTSLALDRSGPKADSLRRIFVSAAEHKEFRMRSTFLNVCEHNRDLMNDPEIKAAVTKLASGSEDGLKVSERAKQLLAGTKIAPPGGG